MKLTISVSNRCNISNLVKIGAVVLSSKEDGRQPIAIHRENLHA